MTLLSTKTKILVGLVVVCRLRKILILYGPALRRSHNPIQTNYRAVET